MPGISAIPGYVRVLPSPNSNIEDFAKEEFENTTPGRVQTTVSRIIRDSSLTRAVKELHDFRCQVCGHAIQLSDGNFYAEAHHIRPLGSPHDGPDILENMMCVCPNHHVELDYRLTTLHLSDLQMKDEHQIAAIYIEYHNKLVEAATAY